MFQPWNDLWISTKVILVWLQFYFLFYGVGEQEPGHHESQVTMTCTDAGRITLLNNGKHLEMLA